MQINKCSMKKYDPEVIIDSLSLFSVCCTVLVTGKRRAHFSRHLQKKGTFLFTGKRRAHFGAVFLRPEGNHPMSTPWRSVCKECQGTIVSADGTLTEIVGLRGSTHI